MNPNPVCFVSASDSSSLGTVLLSGLIRKRVHSVFTKSKISPKGIRSGVGSAPLSVASALCSNFHIQREDFLASKCDSKRLGVETFISAEFNLFHNSDSPSTPNTARKLQIFMFSMKLCFSVEKTCFSIVFQINLIALRQLLLPKR